MPLRHSPPLTDSAKAKEDKARPTKHGAPEQPLSYRIYIPPEEGKAQTPEPPQAATQAGTPPETLNAPAVILSPNDPTHASIPSKAIAFQDNAVTATGEYKPASRLGVITVGGIDFHHESEAEFARLLTYYGIDWDYEPHQFPLQWREGRPVEMFRPDFYLTEYDLYIELTTMRQALVRRKNRKLRLLRALYPEISIKLLYRRDYQRLLERFGIRSEEVEAEWPGRVHVGEDVEVIEGAGQPHTKQVEQAEVD